MNLIQLILTILAMTRIESRAYNILGIFPHLGKSHFDVFLPLMRALTEKGHTVTVISNFPREKPIKNYKDIDIGAKSMIWQDVIDMTQLDPYSRLYKVGNIFLLDYIANLSCEFGLSSPPIQDFLKTKEKYDLMITEVFNSDCFLSLANRVKAPIIGVSSSTLMPWTSSRLANPTHTAYIPNNCMDYSDRMTFYERLENTVVTVFHQFYYDYVMLARDESTVKKHISTKAAKLNDFIMNTSLILSNTHFTLTLPRPLVPNVVEVGGIHIGQPRPLPRNLEKWVNGSSEGVIYFSLGSMIKGNTFPKEQRDAFLKAFARLPYRVLWKWENETMEGKPDNVMVQKWMPQLDILCHPNVKAFISHGGLLGTTEAVHCGVPTIVMPQFGDQHTNARALEASGGGVILQLNEATEEKVYKALKKVLSPGFRQKAKELSERFRDRPLPPLETAIYWVEYVARHKGAPHMRTAAVNMPFYKYYLIDVISFLLLVISTLTYLTYIVIRLIVRTVLKSSSSAKVKTS
uniref:UDP-glucuronosyltransferase n=1 Tax=Xylotrechus quadripes TaxID=554073 RepID=A0A6G7SFD5_9CUCU|nr:UDP-glycosyltransferase [Xylotrechus quadripes]